MAGGISNQIIKMAEKIYLLDVREENKYKEIDKKIEKISIITEELVKEIHSNSNYKIIVNEKFERSNLEKYNLTEFDDFLYEQYVDKKIVIVYGNCHTTIIAQALNQCSEFNIDFAIYPIKPIHTIENAGYFELPIFKNCDVFIHQSIQRGNRYGEEYCSEKIIEKLQPECIKIAIPNVYRLPVCFFPQYTRESEFLKRDGSSVFFRDLILDYAAEAELSYEETLQYYWEKNHFSEEDLNEQLITFFFKVEQREKDWDIKCLDFIKQNFRSVQLFYDPNHPTNEFLLYVTKQLLKFMDISVDEKKLEKIELENLSGYEMPILPEVKEHFGMTFQYKEMRKGSFNKVKLGKMDYESYIKQYLACEWQNEKVSWSYRYMSHVKWYIMKIYNKFWKMGRKLKKI